jgi:hypothetical protein
MSILALAANNKNQYRRYPFKQGTSLLSDEKVYVSDSLIVNCSITTTYGRHKLYVKQIYRKDSFIKIAIASVSDGAVLGDFSGVISEDYTTLQLTAYERFVSGNLTLGLVSALQNITHSLNFSVSANTEFEESTIFCYEHPAVTSIRDVKKNEVRGFVAFGQLTNITKTTNTETKSSNFTATNPSAVLNPADKSTYLNNCSNPIIKAINTVTPFSPVTGTSTVNDGNIYIAGVRPVVFYGNSQNSSLVEPGVVAIASDGVTLDRLCALQHNLVPPVDITGFTLAESKNTYYNKPALSNVTKPSDYPYAIPDRAAGSFRQVTLPEYYFWPQYVGLSYYTDWNLLNPSAPTITSASRSNNVITVVFTPAKKAGAGHIASYDYRIIADTVGSWTSLSGVVNYSASISVNTPNIKGIQLRAVNSVGSTGILSNVFSITS